MIDSGNDALPGTTETRRYRREWPTEDADVSSSSDDYARRFAGAVGQWFLDIQTGITLDLLRGLPPPATVLDVGGGHAQIAPQLIEAGYEITVVGSDPVCAARLAPWTASGRCRFEVANLLSLPYADRSFDAVVCFRLLPHSVSWKGLIEELCRVARRSVILDFPSTRSANLFSSRLFQLKRAIELNTREFSLFNPSEINSAFRRNGFIVRKNRPQFLLPMVLHRWANQSVLSRVAETPGRLLGLTRWFGSPIIIRADRRTASARPRA